MIDMLLNLFILIKKYAKLLKKQNGNIKFKNVPTGFCYSSDNNNFWLTEDVFLKILNE